MIRITIAIYPNGDRSSARIARELVIANDLTGDEFEGNYVAAISGEGGFAEPLSVADLPGDSVSRVRILGHDRTTGIMPLVRKAIEVLS